MHAAREIKRLPANTRNEVEILVVLVVSRAYSSKSCPFVLAEELNGLILEIGDHAGQSATKREAHARVGYISRRR